MSVELDDPLVAAYLARLDAVATSMSQARRAELVADIRGHLVEAMAGVPAGDVAAVQQVLDRLGSPEDIVAAATDDARSAPIPVSIPVSTAADGGRGAWGALEIAAVFLLTVGHLVWVLGPVAGLVLVWASPRWTRREKVFATVLTLLALSLVAAATLLWISGTFGTDVVVVPSPADSTPPSVSP